MKTLALSDPISFLSTLSPPEAGTPHGVAEAQAATGRHDAFATILAESRAESSGASDLAGASAPGQPVMAQAMTQSGAAAQETVSVPSDLDPGIPTRAAPAQPLAAQPLAPLQSLLQETAPEATRVPATEQDDPTLQGLAGPSVAAQKTPAAVPMYQKSGLAAAPEQAKTAIPATAKAGSTSEDRPKADDAGTLANLVQAAEPTPVYSTTTVAAVGGDPGRSASAQQPLAAAAVHPARLAASSPTLQAGETFVATAVPAQPASETPDPAAKAPAVAAVGSSLPTRGHGASALPPQAPGDGTTPAPVSGAAVKDTDAPASHTPHADIPAAASDAPAAEALPADKSTPAAETPPPAGALPDGDPAALMTAQLVPGAAAGQPRARLEQGTAAVETAMTASPSRHVIRGEAPQKTAPGRVQAMAGSAAPAAAGTTSVAQTTGSNQTGALATPVGESVPKADTGTPTSQNAATAGQTPKVVSQDIAVRLVAQGDPGAAVAPRETLAESRVMAALALQSTGTSAEAGSGTSASSPVVEVVSPDAAQSRSVEAEGAIDPALSTASRPKAAMGTDALSADTVMPTLPMPAQAGAAADPDKGSAPQAAKARDEREVNPLKDRVEQVAQAPAAISDASAKPAETIAAPLAGSAGILTPTLSTGQMTVTALGATGISDSGNPAFGADAGAAAGTTRTTSAHAIGQQMSQALADSGNRTVELTLSPEELGKVRMTLHSSDGAITVAVQAERPETLDLMRRNIDSLARDFREMGYSNVEFDFGQQTDQRPSAQERASAETTPRPASPDREVVARFDTASVALQSSPRTASGGLDLRI